MKTQTKKIGIVTYNLQSVKNKFVKKFNSLNSLKSYAKVVDPNTNLDCLDCPGAVLLGANYNFSCSVQWFEVKNETAFLQKFRFYQIVYPDANVSE